MKPSEWTLEMLNQVIAEWKIERRKKQNRESYRRYRETHREEIKEYNRRRRLKLKLQRKD